MPVVRLSSITVTTPIKSAEMLIVEYGMKLSYSIMVPDLCVIKSILMNLDRSDSVYYNKNSTLVICNILAKFIETSKMISEKYNVRQVKYPIMYLDNIFRSCWSNNVLPAYCWNIAILMIVQEVVVRERSIYMLSILSETWLHSLLHLPDFLPQSVVYYCFSFKTMTACRCI